jgi:probable HAF family extracellular repeat protein
MHMFDHFPSSEDPQPAHRIHYAMPDPDRIDTYRGRLDVLRKSWNPARCSLLKPGEDFIPESNAWGINDAGHVVGSATVRGGDHAFLWTPAGGMQDLNALIDPLDPLKGVTTLVSARDIKSLSLKPTR